VEVSTYTVAPGEPPEALITRLLPETAMLPMVEGGADTLVTIKAMAGMLVSLVKFATSRPQES